MHMYIYVNIQKYAPLTYTGVCWRMLTYAHVCSRMLTYAHVCSRVLTDAARNGSGCCWRGALAHRCCDDVSRSPTASLRERADACRLDVCVALFYMSRLD